MKYKTVASYRKAMIKIWGVDGWLDHEKFEKQRLTEYLAELDGGRKVTEDTELDAKIRSMIREQIADIDAEIAELERG